MTSAVFCVSVSALFVVLAAIAIWWFSSGHLRAVRSLTVVQVNSSGKPTSVMLDARSVKSFPAALLSTAEELFIENANAQSDVWDKLPEMGSLRSVLFVDADPKCLNTRLCLPHCVRRLAIADFPVCDECLARVADSVDLSELSINAGSLSSHGLSHVSRLHNLTYLSLSHAWFTEETVRHIAALTKLRHLFLSETNMDDHLVEALLQLESLEELALDGSAISNAALQSLSKMNGLRRVDVGRTRVDSEGIAKALESMPMCSVRM